MKSYQLFLQQSRQSADELFECFDHFVGLTLKFDGDSGLIKWIKICLPIFNITYESLILVVDEVYTLNLSLRNFFLRPHFMLTICLAK